MKLSPEAIDKELRARSHWTLDADQLSISREWTFPNFKAGMQFFWKVGEIAELHDHHPELYLNYTHMRIRLSTHDVNGLTDKDFHLAKAIDDLIIRDPR